jgi:hypothetical protein
MAMKRHKPEEIVGKLRQADVLHCQGMSMADAIRQIGPDAPTPFMTAICIAATVAYCL